MRLPRPIRRTPLESVFGTGPSPLAATYFDRGELDKEMARARAGGLHVAIHGESKHGKSWLRAQALRDEDPARVQCIPGMSAQDVLIAALGRLGVTEEVRIVLEESSSASVRLETGVDAKVVSSRVEGELSEEQSRSVEGLPVGRNTKTIDWVAEQFRTVNRRPVFEDFHNLAIAEQRRMAFAIKALGEWDVPCVVAGIWPDNHLLTYHNGELDGRIADLVVRWSGEELEQVLIQGCRELHVEMSHPLRRRIVLDSHASVGLLQQLAKEFLTQAGVARGGVRKRTFDDTEADLTVYERARATVVESIAGRFNPFVDRFVKGPSGDPPTTIYREILRAVVERVDVAELLEGVSVESLRNEISIERATVTTEEVKEGLSGLAGVQREHQIHPHVLAHDYVRGRLVLADRRFLLYVEHGPNEWPWR
jgi:hypothetical protein